MCTRAKIITGMGAFGSADRSQYIMDCKNTSNDKMVTREFKINGQFTVQDGEIHITFQSRFKDGEITFNPLIDLKNELEKCGKYASVCKVWVTGHRNDLKYPIELVVRNFFSLPKSSQYNIKAIPFDRLNEKSNDLAFSNTLIHSIQPRVDVSYIKECIEFNGPLPAAAETYSGTDNAFVDIVPIILKEIDSTSTSNHVNGDDDDDELHDNNTEDDNDDNIRPSGVVILNDEDIRYAAVVECTAFLGIKSIKSYRNTDKTYWSVSSVEMTAVNAYMQNTFFNARRYTTFHNTSIECIIAKECEVEDIITDITELALDGFNPGFSLQITIKYVAVNQSNQGNMKVQRTELL